MEHCCVIWLPTKQAVNDKLERLQEHFTSRINGMEHMYYHYRLKELELCIATIWGNLGKYAKTEHFTIWMKQSN